MPDLHDFAKALQPYQRRLRIAACANATLMASGVAALTLSAGALAGLSGLALPAAGAAALVGTAVAASYFWCRRWTLAHVAGAVDLHAARRDNIVVTMEEVASGKSRRPHPTVFAALEDATAERLRATPANRVQPVAREMTLAIGAILAVATFGFALPKRGAHVVATVAGGPVSPSPLRTGDLRVVVTPPEYVSRPATEAINPSSITVLEGSRVRLETPATAANVTLVDGRDTRRPFVQRDGTLSVEIGAGRSQPLIVRSDAAGAESSRLIYMRVQPDARPSVRIARPAADLMFPSAAQQVPLDIEAQDDVGLTLVELKYTVVSGSGEAFTFKEGTWPVDVVRDGAGDWKARGLFVLERLGLQDGDTLVYRAVARDGKPGADPSTSETFLIEIGKLAGVASTGFALPDERDRQGLSQQMLIIKTERLHNSRATLSPDAVIEQSRLLAVEQRMVRSEFVFMTGGEVADEVEEATHAHELAEGRLENSAQVELLNAIREMSRAEARLNDGDTTQALPFERAALRALQRAFDRRRYLLRTLPERTRIDPARRLTGDFSSARSSNRTTEAAVVDPAIARARVLLRELAVARTNRSDLPLLASRIIALDQSSDGLHEAAVALVSASAGTAQDAALRETEERVLALLQERLAAVPEPVRLRTDPVAGNVARDLQRRREGAR